MGDSLLTVVPSIWWVLAVVWAGAGIVVAIAGHVVDAVDAMHRGVLLAASGVALAVNVTAAYAVITYLGHGGIDPVGVVIACIAAVCSWWGALTYYRFGFRYVRRLARRRSFLWFLLASFGELAAGVMAYSLLF